MISLREKVFETNSSSCHVLTMISKDELKNLSANRHDVCIYLPNTGDYQTGSEYKILTNEEAFERYNKAHEMQPYESVEAFEDALEKDLVDDDVGKYLCFSSLMAHVVIENDLSFDIFWWNND